MSERAAFGPNLRRTRIHHGLSLEALANETKVPVALWKGLEDSNLAGWPRGIYARAYVREYAQFVGVDPDETVNEFCRLFPEGDRRQGGLLREHAEIVGHDLDWTDDLRGAPDRRSPMEGRSADGASPVARRMLAAVIDSSMVLALASLIGIAVPLTFSSRAVAVVALCYVLHVVTGGNTPALRLTESVLKHAQSGDALTRRVRVLLRSGKRSEDPSRGMS